MNTSYRHFVVSGILMPCLLLWASAACNDDDIHASEKGGLKIYFDNRFGDQDLQLNTEHLNINGEILRVTTLKYFISNIQLRSTSGHQYVVSQDSSYFLVTENDPRSQMITLNNIPVGDYNELTFTIGIDSLRSTMGLEKRTGILDPAQGHDGMYWTWNSGYIFFKFEGTSPSAPSHQEHKFYYHIGGYGGFDSPTLNNIRQKTLNLGSARAEIRSNKLPELHIHVDIQKLFGQPNSFTIKSHSLVMFSEFSTKISENYVNMFRFDHIHN